MDWNQGQSMQGAMQAKTAFDSVQSGAMLGISRLNAPPLENASVSSMVQLLGKQTMELRERIATVTGNICGSTPANAKDSQSGPNCLIEVLQELSRTLGESLAEIARLQSRL